MQAQAAYRQSRWQLCRLRGLKASVLQEGAQLILRPAREGFGGHFHVVVGEGFSFEITYQYRHMLHLYYGENVAVVVFKC